MPAAISARNAVIVASDLVLKRDIYYTQYPGRVDYSLGLGPALSAIADRTLRLLVGLFAVSQPGKREIIGVRDRFRPIFHDGRQQPAQQGQPRLGLGRFRLGSIRSQVLGGSPPAR